MIEINFKDGSSINAEEGIKLFELLKSAPEELSKGALAAEVNGKVRGLSETLTEDSSVNFLTFEDEGGRLAFRHTASHVLAQAIQRLYPGTKFAIGPAINDGFYYDVDSETVFTPELLEKLEDEMRKIIKENIPLERFELGREEALKLMGERGEIYKIELITDLPEDAVISFYKQGDFTDLCAGPHLTSTGKLKANAIKLTSCTGAYWRGDSKRKMLQRIYGTCFPKKE
ncbi:MAG: threonine--tRNA ligase, partial [Papillibacter sp.]|nr:threonine--tRNA ligase [Papillibacter sp.]